MSQIIFPSVYPVTGHTDFVGQGSTFVAITGSKQNGLNFVPLALEKGAKKIVVSVNETISQELAKLTRKHNAKLEFVDDTRKALAELSAQALDFPAKRLKIVGITGTKGKTSSSYMAYHMLHAIGKKVALVSTIEKRIGSELIAMPLTTPLPDQLQMFLRLCVDHAIEYVVLEVSAQALTLNRVEGIDFLAGVFTNFSHEHLEFYKNLPEYFAAKALLVNKIKNPKNMFINIDDQYGHQLFLKNPECSTFSFQNKQATLYGCTHQADGQVMLHVKNNNELYSIFIPFLGTFNAYNLLGVLGLMRALEIDFSQLKYALKDLPHVPGRMEKYQLKNGAICFIDYAHNPSSFEAVLSTLRSMTSHLIVVFGAGGNRDPQKRPLMGAIAQKYCDVVIVTSDNPRDESPLDIALAIEKGFDFTKKFEFYQELNRVKAIELGHELSKKGSVLAILGKGRDEYQIVGALTFPFKERSIIRPFMIEHEHSN
ncbi:UDP-N-acetylmuramoyl-L-alanyl-D-glutamate--2,6-diaminopimelate ligase [Candidatus Dependentiae bacterium]|nr:UDP-N-acetylmuramoyl-L-alanyl-D-glutamate--2,6-diaminopimelate ligase [Candidatus Dependentiae bacterium]